MLICVAGKNHVAVEGLKLINNLYGKNHDIVFISGQEDPSGWQPSLRKTGNNLGIREAKIEDLYEIEDLVFISLEYPKILKTKKFKSKKLYNIHFSKLPCYKGMYTSTLPILNGEINTGVTLHLIDDGIDTGPIIDQIVFDINYNYTARDLYIQYNKHAVTLLENNIQSILNNTVVSTVQSIVGSSYYSKNSIDFNNIVVDYNKTAYQIHNQIRAYSFKEYQLPKFQNREIINCVILETRSLCTKPGSILSSNLNSVTIATIDYDILLEF